MCAAEEVWSTGIGKSKIKGPFASSYNCTSKGKLAIAYMFLYGMKCKVQLVSFMAEGIQ